MYFKHPFKMLKHIGHILFNLYLIINSILLLKCLNSTPKLHIEYVKSVFKCDAMVLCGME